MIQHDGEILLCIILVIIIAFQIQLYLSSGCRDDENSCRVLEGDQACMVVGEEFCSPIHSALAAFLV